MLYSRSLNFPNPGGTDSAFEWPKNLFAYQPIREAVVVDEQFEFIIYSLSKTRKYSLINGMSS